MLFVTHSVFESTYLSSRVVVMTPRPGRVYDDIALSPPPARDERWRMTPEFGRDAARVSSGVESGDEGRSANEPQLRILIPILVGIARAGCCGKLLVDSIRCRNSCCRRRARSGSPSSPISPR